MVWSIGEKIPWNWWRYPYFLQFITGKKPPWVVQFSWGCHLGRLLLTHRKCVPGTGFMTEPVSRTKMLKLGVRATGFTPELVSENPLSYLTKLFAPFYRYVEVLAHFLPQSCWQLTQCHRFLDVFPKQAEDFYHKI
jgi:hypothetical protein